MTRRDEVGVALKTLSFHELRAAVLIDTESGEYKGFVDMMDIVSYALFTADCLRLTPNHRDLTQDSIEDLLFKGQLFISQQISGIEQSSQFKKIMWVTKDTPLLHVIQQFARDGQRRAAVIDFGGDQPKEGQDVKLNFNKHHCVNIITQTDILGFLIENIAKLNGMGQQTPKDLGFAGKDQMIQVDGYSTSVYYVLKLIHDKEISGLPLVNKEGKLIGNFSASDMKAVSEAWEFKFLNLPVMSYLRFTHQKEPVPIFCSIDTTLETILSTMSRHQIHRIYVVDSEMKPIDVVSMCDVVRLLASSIIEA